MPRAALLLPPPRTLAPPSEPQGAPTDHCDGVDISNYTGYVDDAFINALRTANVQHVCVRLSWETPRMQEICWQQQDALAAARFSLSGYIWMYWNRSGTSNVDLAVNQAVQPLTHYYLDAEGDPPDADTIIRTMHEGCDRLDRLGKRAGMYLNGYWWRDHTGNYNGFADRPLLYAWGDYIPSFETWNYQAFGGWAYPFGKQYHLDTYIGGRVVDKDIFDYRVLAMEGS